MEKRNKTTGIPEGYKVNFDTLREAAINGNLALLDCQDRKTQEPVMTVCAVNLVDGEYVMMPIAKLFDGDPFEELNPPKVGGGYYEGD